MKMASIVCLILILIPSCRKSRAPVLKYDNTDRPLTVQDIRKLALNSKNGNEILAYQIVDQKADGMGTFKRLAALKRGMSSKEAMRLLQYEGIEEKMKNDITVWTYLVHLEGMAPSSLGFYVFFYDDKIEWIHVPE